MNQEEMLVLFTQTSLLRLVSGHHPSVPSMTLFPSLLPLKLLKVSEGRFPLRNAPSVSLRWVSRGSLGVKGIGPCQLWGSESHWEQSEGQGEEAHRRNQCKKQA